MIDAAIFLGAFAAALNFSVGVFADRYGPDVSGRFLEINPRYDAASLIDWVTHNPTKARGYIFPVLFPFDVMFLICLGGFLGLGSVIAAHTLKWPPYADWLLVLAPMLFMACDFAEDVMLSRFLLSPPLVTKEAVAVAKAATNAKIVTCSIAIFQTMVVSALGLLS